MECADSKQKYLPYIKTLELHGLPEIKLNQGAFVFVVGPNNGGKSTFLNETRAQLNNVSETKWVSGVQWELGSEDQFKSFIDLNFRPAAKPSQLIDKRTGHTVPKPNIYDFFGSQKTTHPSFLIKLLDAQNRISLADEQEAPSVIEKTILHPYHYFFFELGAEIEFSKKVEAAFGVEFRVNRTGSKVVGFLGEAPTGDRLSEKYEREIVEKMRAIPTLGDGVRSYTGILLNAISDPRPVTVVDEPEAFLHPPQARRLGHEMALASKNNGQQVFVATHSADFIQGALSAKNPNTIFLYLDHSYADRPLYEVDRVTVEQFSRKPLLVHTGALDGLFYDQIIVCEGEADIMFFKWAMQNTTIESALDESFWISSYGKSAIPYIVSDMRKLGLKVRCVFDLDVLLSPDVLSKVCSAFQIPFEEHKKLLERLAKSIKVPPSGEVLGKIEAVIDEISENDEDEHSRLVAIRQIKKSAESLGKSWVLKSAGMAAVPKGKMFADVSEFILLMSQNGIIILQEGEIENYVPEIGGHGQHWVRAVLEAGVLSSASRRTIENQFQVIAQ